MITAATASSSLASGGKHRWVARVLALAAGAAGRARCFRRRLLGPATPLVLVVAHLRGASGLAVAERAAADAVDEAVHEGIERMSVGLRRAVLPQEGQHRGVAVVATIGLAHQDLEERRLIAL